MPLKAKKTAVRRFHCGSRTARLCWEELPDGSQVLAFVAKTEDGPGHLWLKTTPSRQGHSQWWSRATSGCGWRGRIQHGLPDTDRGSSGNQNPQLSLLETLWA